MGGFLKEDYCEEKKQVIFVGLGRTLEFVHFIGFHHFLCSLLFIFEMNSILTNIYVMLRSTQISYSSRSRRSECRVREYDER